MGKKKQNSEAISGVAGISHTDLHTWRIRAGLGAPSVHTATLGGRGRGGARHR